MDFGARVVIQDPASGQWSGRRTDDLYDERSICTTNGSHWPTRSLEDYGSEASHVALVPGESGTVVDRRRARKAAQAASTSTMEAACDQSRRPRCWPLGRGAHPVRGCSASASGYLQQRWRRRSTLPTLLVWNDLGTCTADTAAGVDALGIVPEQQCQIVRLPRSRPLQLARRGCLPGCSWLLRLPRSDSAAAHGRAPQRRRR